MAIISAPFSAIITVGAIDGGVRNNIIPDEVRMSGTIRTFDPHRMQAVSGIQACGARRNFLLPGSLLSAGVHVLTFRLVVPGA